MNSSSYMSTVGLRQEGILLLKSPQEITLIIGLGNSRQSEQPRAHVMVHRDGLFSSQLDRIY